MSVAIVDYGSGNLHSARKAFERADSRQHDMIGGEHILRPRGDAHLATQAGLARGALEGFPR